MSPILFNIYMNDLSTELNSCNVGCMFNGKMVNHFLYADDSSLLAPSPSGLQTLIDICDKYAMKNCIIYNELKTNCMCFKPKSMSKLIIPDFYLNNVKLNLVNIVKYLGVFICDDLSDCDDMSRHSQIYLC